MDRRFNILRIWVPAVIVILACNGAPDTPADRTLKLDVPRGYMSRVEVVHEGRRYRFGPFVGYYFYPVDPQDLLHLNFVVYNEDAFYTLERPVNAKLFEGRAVFTTLPDVGRTLPSADAQDRINPVFFEETPQQWLQSRPRPQGEYRHFHSCYDARGAVRHGYWLRHVGLAEFTYDMGGRVTADSPLYHRVKNGVDLDFAPIVEFDRGPW
jgi:hypothetical protein